MKRGRTAPRQPFIRFLETACERANWLVLITGAVIIPLVVVPSAYDPFRAPKALLLTGEALALAGLTIAAIALGARTWSEGWPVALKWLVGGVLVWCAVTTLSSTSVQVSSRSFLVALSALMVFVSANVLGRRRGTGTLLIVLLPAVVNSVVALGQRSGAWMLFHFESQLGPRPRTIGLLGNPDDVGTYLMLPAIAALVVAISSRKYRWPAAAMTIVITAATFATETVSAIAGMAAGMLATAFLVSRKAAAVLIVALIATTALFAVVLPQRWQQLRESIAVARTGNFDPLLSNRMPGFVTAWHMFQEHPLLGVGLGCFHVHYFDEKIAAEEHFPTFLNIHMENFGEAHNEHLQILAEGGAPAYVLFLAALVILARRSFVKLSPENDRSTPARTLAFPAAISLGIVSLAQFPMRLAAPTLTIMMITGLVMSWTEAGAA